MELATIDQKAAAPKVRRGLVLGDEVTCDKGVCTVFGRVPAGWNVRDSRGGEWFRYRYELVASINDWVDSR